MVNIGSARILKSGGRKQLSPLRFSFRFESCQRADGPRLAQYSTEEDRQEVRQFYHHLSGCHRTKERSQYLRVSRRLLLTWRRSIVCFSDPWQPRSSIIVHYSALPWANHRCEYRSVRYPAAVGKWLLWYCSRRDAEESPRYPNGCESNADVVPRCSDSIILNRKLFSKREKTVGLRPTQI